MLADFCIVNRNMNREEEKSTTTSKKNVKSFPCSSENISKVERRELNDFLHPIVESWIVKHEKVVQLAVWSCEKSIMKMCTSLTTAINIVVERCEFILSHPQVTVDHVSLLLIYLQWKIKFKVTQLSSHRVFAVLRVVVSNHQVVHTLLCFVASAGLHCMSCSHS